jgi:hypothetical protein
MPKLKRNHFSGLSNIFGEKGKNLSDLLNAKPDHDAFDAIEALPDDPEPSAADIAAKVNEILAALKTPVEG